MKKMSVFFLFLISLLLTTINSTIPQETPQTPLTQEEAIEESVEEAVPEEETEEEIEEIEEEEIEEEEEPVEEVEEVVEEEIEEELESVEEVVEEVVEEKVIEEEPEPVEEEIEEEEVVVVVEPEEEEEELEEEPEEEEFGEFEEIDEEGFGAEGEQFTIIGEAAKLAQMANPANFVTRVLGLLQLSLGRIITAPLHLVMKQIEKTKDAIIEGFKKNQIIKLPRIGIFKFIQMKEKAEAEMVGTLHDLEGKTIKKLQFGPLRLDLLKIMVTGGIPKIEGLITLFKKQGEIKQITSSEGEVTFTLTFKKPFLIPTGLKRRAKIEQFILKMSADKQILYTDVNIFGTTTEEPSRISLNIAEPPFAFKIQSKNIPMGVIAPALKATPLKAVIFKSLTLEVIPLPPTVSLTGIADLSKVKLGIPIVTSEAKVKASMGLMGFNFIFQLTNIKLPLNLGVIHKAQLRITQPTMPAM